MTPPRFTAAFAALALLFLRATAQDVTLSPLQWRDPARAPDEYPVLKSARPLTLPPELRQSPDIAYACCDAVVGEDGSRLMFGAHATAPAYLRLAETDATAFRFKPGKRGGEAVTTAVSFALLYNPASAAVAGPEATPRLLDVAPVRLKPKKGAPPVTEDTVAFAEVEVGADGTVTKVENAPPALLAAMQVAARNWRFAPARHLGQPVSQVIHAPFLILAPPARGAPKHQTSPQVISQTSPRYPAAMRASGMRGEVLVDFILDIEGRPRNAHVVRTLNPAFDDAALDALRKWRFRPATADGVPINTHMQVPIIFQLSQLEDGGSDGFELTRPADVSKLPPEFQYDTPPRIRASARPVYPYEALTGRQEGKVTVLLMIDRQGRVARAEVQEATRPEFGLATLAALDRFSYAPAVKDGRPGPAMLRFHQSFSLDPDSGSVSDDELDLARRVQKKPQSILSAHDLDGALKPLSRQQPMFPSRFSNGQPVSGDALIEFIIDEEGRARLPRIVSASEPEFGYAAAQSIATWRFESPTRGGRAVAVRVQIPMKFSGGTPTVPPPPEP